MKQKNTEKPTALEELDNLMELTKGFLEATDIDHFPKLAKVYLDTIKFRWEMNNTGKLQEMAQELKELLDSKQSEINQYLEGKNYISPASDERNGEIIKL